MYILGGSVIYWEEVLYIWRKLYILGESFIYWLGGSFKYCEEVGGSVIYWEEAL